MLRLCGGNAAVVTLLSDNLRYHNADAMAFPPMPQNAGLGFVMPIS
jgi:hypothetical protein